MKCIVRIKWDNKLEVMKSSNIIDKNDHYCVEFTYPNGYVQCDYVDKDLYGSVPMVKFCTWENLLYVTEKKYKEDPEHWISLVKSWRRENDTRKWLRDK